MSGEAAAEAAAAERGRSWRRFELRDLGIVLAFVALFVGLAVATDPFLTQRNLLNILDQSAPLGIVACAVTICIIAGIFDLSTGAIFAVSAVVATKLANSIDPYVGLVAGALAGLALGILNGVLVHYTRINSFIGTLATSIVYGGVAIVVTGGTIVTVDATSFGSVGQGSVLGITDPGWIFIIFTILVAALMARTTLGRYVYAVGGNAEAARLSGIRVGAIRGTCFAIAGFAAGLAGMLLASRTQSAQASLGTGMELTAIAAAVVGGTSIFGGDGAVWRGFLGVMLLAIIGNGFDLLNVSTTYQQMVYGLLILIAVAADQLLRRRS